MPRRTRRPFASESRDQINGGSWGEGGTDVQIITPGGGQLLRPSLINWRNDQYYLPKGVPASALTNSQTFFKDFVHYVPIIIPHAVTLDELGVYVNTLSGGGPLVDLMLYDDEQGIPGNLLASTTGVSVASAVKCSQVVAGSIAVEAGMKWLAFQLSLDKSLKAFIGTTIYNEDLIGRKKSDFSEINYYKEAATYGTIPDPAFSVGALTTVDTSSGFPLVFMSIA